MRSYSPNVFPNPIDPYAWAVNGGGFQMTLSRDTTMTRQYGSIPLKIVTSGTSAYTGTYNALAWNLAPAANGQTWTFSFWTKGSSNYSASAMIFEANSSGGYIALGHTYYNVTTSWTRVSGTYTFSNASAAYVQFRIDNYNNGVTQWVDSIQVERASAATTFNPYYFGNAVWKDVSGNSNNSSLVNTDSQNYFSTNAGYIQFDGTDDYVSISSPNTNTRLQNNYQTVSFFVYITSVGPNGVTYLYAVGGNTNGACITWGTTFMTFLISDAASNVGYDVAMTNALNTWMNITSIVNNINRTMTVYKNGSLVGTSTQWDLFTIPSSAVTIGNNSMTGNTGDRIKGRVANVLVYNRALSAAEISQNYETDKSKFGL